MARTSWILGPLPRVRAILTGIVERLFSKMFEIWRRIMVASATIMYTGYLEAEGVVILFQGSILGSWSQFLYLPLKLEPWSLQTSITPRYKVAFCAPFRSHKTRTHWSTSPCKETWPETPSPRLSLDSYTAIFDSSLLIRTNSTERAEDEEGYELLLSHYGCSPFFFLSHFFIKFSHIDSCLNVG